MIASTRRTWARAQQNIRVDEARKDCRSIQKCLADGELDVREAGLLLTLALRAAEDDVRQLDQFIAAGGPSA